MKGELILLPSGGVTAPRGFLAGATCAGIKYADRRRPDLALLFSEVPAAAAAVFTTNKVRAAPVLLSAQRLKKGRAQAVVVNSGCANACTGEKGLADAVEMTELAAHRVGVAAEDVLIASTGVIGGLLPMERIRSALAEISLSAEGGHDFARAIMTTDTVPKEVAVKAGGFTIGGVAKGSGMIHPQLATMLAFITTDAPVDIIFLRRALKRAVGISFNMVSVDGDSSTNDTVIVLANGMAGGEVITSASQRADIFRQALEHVCMHLAREIARDGEGAKHLIEVRVRGAKSLADARICARAIAGSMLVKTAVYGADPNWGRVLAAAGRSGAVLKPERVALFMGDICVFRNGMPLIFDRDGLVRYLRGREVIITLDLNLGRGQATAWGCDLTEEYVKINAEYTT